MDKQKRIESMAKELEDNPLIIQDVYFFHERGCWVNSINYEKTAETLINASYGNLKEFAERLKERKVKMLSHTYMVTVEDIDRLLKEYTK